jgi:hypothetical protein
MKPGLYALVVSGAGISSDPVFVTVFASKNGSDSETVADAAVPVGTDESLWLDEPSLESLDRFFQEIMEHAREAGPSSP